MFSIKRLYTFILKTFSPLLVATFSVCLFVLLMFFVWQFVEEMVGKGVDLNVLAELFFYASITFISQALPLAILLASLMTFGNLGEHMELTAMKASGISLVRIMKPLIITVIFLAGLSFLFQNNISPKAQAKMYTILYSLRHKSPELDIPEKTFFKDIPGYNLFVKEKDKKTGMLYDMMIYDYSNGFENAVVILADSGKLHTLEDKTNLVLTMYNGESFENLEPKRRRNMNENVPYKRETFKLRTVLIEFDSNFNMMDESIMGNREMSKSINSLSEFADNLSAELDSINKTALPQFKTQVYEKNFYQRATNNKEFIPVKEDSLLMAGFDTLFDSFTPENKAKYYQTAKSRVENFNQDYFLQREQQKQSLTQVRRHIIEIHRKFALSFSCILFFFIGAPLGAIIRKGGLGVPVVLSVFVYLLYYTLDILGLKMARQAIWPIWEGMWLSSAVLLVLGVFLTYKALNDSSLMTPDAWKSSFIQFISKFKRKRKNNNK